MAKISLLPAAAPLTGDEALPVVQAGRTRRAGLTALSAQFDALAAAYAAAAAGLVNFRTTRAQGVADFPVGAFFSSAEGGELRLYERIAAPPYYQDQGDGVAPITRGGLADPGERFTSIAYPQITGLRTPGLFNWDRTRFPRWRAAVAEFREGGRIPGFALIGDSTTSGVGSNDESATANCRERALPMQLAEVLTALGLPAQADSIWGDGFEGANIVDFDPRLSLAAGWAIHPTLFCAGGRVFIDESETSPEMAWNVEKPTDRFVVRYIRYDGYADFIATSAGLYVGSASTNGAAGVSTAVFSRELTDAPWVLRKSSLTAEATLLIEGVEAYNSADRRIRLWPMGASGSKVAHWIDDNQPYSFVNALPEFAPRLTRHCLTINDWAAATPAAEFKAGTQVMIDAIRQTSDLYLVVGIPSNEDGPDGVPIERQQEFAEYTYELARLNDLPLINYLELWTSQSFMPDLGRYFDGKHASRFGYRDQATIEGRLIASIC